MLIHATKPLFAWDELEVSPTLGVIKDALRAIPDGQLLATLNQRRHNGCDTYPVSVLWGVLLLSIILRHTTTEACLEELKRNAPLRLLIGIESEDAVPNGWNMTRFLAVLGLPEQGGEAGVRVEAGEAAPVDRPVAADQGRGFAIADQAVIFNLAGQ